MERPTTPTPGRLPAAARTVPTPLGVVTAVATPAVATGLASLIWSNRPAGATSVFLLAVLGAAVVGGVWSGVIAAVLSFLSLNFFFIPPTHTLAVRHPADLAALLVFLLVAVGAGLLVGRVVTERDRARRRAAESEHLRAFTSSLASGRPLGDVLPRLASDLRTLLALAACAIVLDLPDGQVATGDAQAGDGDVTLPIGPEDAPFGRLTARRGPGEPPLTPAERALLGAFRDQLELAAGRVRTEAEARRARLDADASSLRAALFSAVTHDLRTPLASITASVTGLLDSWDALDADQRRELLVTIDEEASRLNRLVGNLLDLARMRAGALAPSPEPAGVDEVVQAVIARLRPVLEPFRVRTVIRPNLPDAWIDQMMIDQVVTNILENAARFSPPGTEITVTVASFQGGVEVRIADQGPGIPAKDRAEVFEPFVRRDAGAGRGGTGLGLAIARAIVVAHGGRISIEGAPGGGTVVVFRIPVDRTPAPAPAKAGP
ncbi:MAG TPA: ATP-binding protein [Actinomycetota bacterium]